MRTEEGTSEVELKGLTSHPFSDRIDTERRKENKTMLNEREMEIWETLENWGIATQEEIGLAVALCGTSEQTLNQVLYIRTGYRTIEQMFEEEKD